MKKIVAGIAVTACVAVLGGATVLAAGFGQQYRQNSSPAAGSPGNTSSQVCEYCLNAGHCFADSNGDGVCDYAGTHAQTHHYNYCGSGTESSLQNGMHHGGQGHHSYGHR
ncbi:hypothetical protein B5F07_12830 [Lachnoclostridium sp. An169]|uniref:hypothetical protein n=1 Tax=Lachnoclostridium sp. An169 TaxID=1965569 RepID=UPI000B36B517|nr:hypothetical protein [Lachnoclostridium sp. An169]OUP82837.1 hypothetical protein B5F07_12830 [Lachnoclostridium sp. An169]